MSNEGLGKRDKAESFVTPLANAARPDKPGDMWGAQIAKKQ
jgi:hypothetical protein